MHDIYKYLHPPSMKDGSYESANWDVRYGGFFENETRIAMEDVIPSSIQYKLEDNQEDYCSQAHKYWCDLLSTIEIKDNMKKSATQIKSIVNSRAVSNSDSNESVRVTRKNRVKTGVIQSQKQQWKIYQSIMSFIAIAHFSRSQ